MNETTRVHGKQVESVKLDTPANIKKNKKTLILEAALRIIARDGLRGLTYRQVAEEAQVPLGLTTYYFKGIESLYVVAFTMYASQVNAKVQNLFDKGCEYLIEYQETIDPHEVAIKRLIDRLSLLTSEYLYTAVTTEREHRLIELAFQHAAAVNPEINELVKNREVLLVELSTRWFEEFGAQDCVLKSDLLIGLFRRLELKAVLDTSISADKKYLKKSMLGFFELALAG